MINFGNLLLKKILTEKHAAILSLLATRHGVVPRQFLLKALKKHQSLSFAQKHLRCHFAETFARV